MLVISNTSPLLYLNLVGHLWLLPELYGDVAIPPSVQAELQAGASGGIRVPHPSDHSWLRVVPLQSRQLLPLVTDLEPGESEAIGLALEHPGSRLILDDQLGRRIARLNRLTITGTLGVVLKAKAAGLVPSVTPVVQELRTAGLWLSDELVAAVLAQAGEPG
jgi:predicted nucleic acid-binding protein